MIRLGIAGAVADSDAGYAMELEATGMLLAGAETQARVRAFLDERR